MSAKSWTLDPDGVGPNMDPNSLFWHSYDSSDLFYIDWPEWPKMPPNPLEYVWSVTWVLTRERTVEKTKDQKDMLLLLFYLSMG